MDSESLFQQQMPGALPENFNEMRHAGNGTAPDLDDVTRMARAFVNEHTHSSPFEPGDIIDGYYSAEQNCANSNEAASWTPSFDLQFAHSNGAHQPCLTSTPNYLDCDDELRQDSVTKAANHQQQKRTSNSIKRNSTSRSKRAEKRAKIIEQHGSVGARDMPRGKTRLQDGLKEWYDPCQRKWHSAAPLDDYRHRIIAEDNARDGYDYAPAYGEHVDDVTTYPINDKLGQKYWDFRFCSSWSNIKDEEGNEVMYLLQQPATNVQSQALGYMTYNGVIMLGPDDYPIYNWPNIPRCISSSIEGGRLEAFRRIYPWITLIHFRARMPRIILKRTVDGKPLFGMSSITQRLKRFRERNNCPPWRNANVAADEDPVQYARPILVEDGLETINATTLRHLRSKGIQAYEGPFPKNGRDSAPAEEGHRVNEERRLAAGQGDQTQALETSRALMSTTNMKRKHEDSVLFGTSENQIQKRQRLSPAVAAYPSPQASSIIALRSMSDPSHYDPPLSENFFPQLSQDLRHVAPLTVSEQLSIKLALSYTVKDYRFFNGDEPPNTNSEDSYSTQYNYIQAFHSANWFLPEGAPQLIGIGEWYGSFDTVPIPEMTEEEMQRSLPSPAGDKPALTDSSMNQNTKVQDDIYDWENTFDCPMQSEISCIPEKNKYQAQQTPHRSQPRGWRTL